MTPRTSYSRSLSINNVHIQEYKVASCDIRPGRRPRGSRPPELVAALPATGGRRRGVNGSATTDDPGGSSSCDERAKPRMGFFTDTRCASAARHARWRARSGTDVRRIDIAGIRLHRRVLRQHGRPRRRHLAARRVRRAGSRSAAEPRAARSSGSLERAGAAASGPRRPTRRPTAGSAG